MEQDAAGSSSSDDEAAREAAAEAKRKKREEDAAAAAKLKLENLIIEGKMARAARLKHAAETRTKGKRVLRGSGPV